MATDDDQNDRTRSFEALTAGSRISHYLIINKVGSGGMGEVYLAQDTELDRRVALKFLPIHLCPDEDCRRRFRREAQAAARLSHPNIIHVYEVSEYQGRPFFSMEHIEGSTLKECFCHREMRLEKILELTIQICGGLQAAHEAGVVHRDIKPANIIMDSHGRARIVDFGLATVKGAVHLTKTGSTMGTIGYMSPEQVRGDEIDHRSDLFSLGVVLYELITGHAPFTADTEAATLHAITHQEPEPIARYRRRASEGLQGIINKLLEKSTETRYQHADGLLSDLIREKRRLEPETIEHPAVTRTSGARRGLWIAATLVALVCVLALWQPWQIPSTGGPPEKIMLAVLPFENLGDSADGYFADGVTDEILTDLAQLSGMFVISRTSSMQYKGSTKGLKEIGEELGVDYVLEGTIRWEKSGETDRVRISPQLIQIKEDVHLWAESYDAVLTDIFDVQSNIARQVAEALDIALLQSESEALSKLPTNSPLAYDYYLRGKQYFTVAAYRPADLNLAEMFHRKAIELDSGFAVAYAELGMVYVEMYWDRVDRTESRLDTAHVLISHALSLAPDIPETRQALGWYYYHGRRDFDKALAEFSRVLELQPNHSLAIASTAWVMRRQGKWEEAIELLRQAVRIDPKQSWYRYELALSYSRSGQFGKAIPYYNQILSSRPDQKWAHVLKAYTIFHLTGSTDRTRAVLDTAMQHLGRWPVVTLMEVYYNMCDGQYDLALELLQKPGDAYLYEDMDSTTFYSLRGFIYRLKDQPEIAVPYFDSARVILESRVASSPNEPRFHGELAECYAFLDRKEEAIAAALRAVELLPVSTDALDGPDYVSDLAIVYTLVGEYDLALDQLEYLSTFPNDISVAWLTLAPEFEDLRQQPRFSEVLERFKARSGS